MRSVTWILGVGLFLVLAGCQAGEQRSCRRAPGPATKRGHTTARVIELRTISLDQTVETRDVLRLADARGPRRTWQIVLGPNPDRGPARLRYSNDEPIVDIEDGWIYVVTGQPASSPPATQPGTPWGQARTHRVSGTALGTRFIVQQEGDVHRVFLLNGPGHTVRVELDRDPGQTRDLTAENTYFEVTEDQSELRGPFPIPAELAGFVEYVQEAGVLSGISP